MANGLVKISTIPNFFCPRKSMLYLVILSLISLGSSLILFRGVAARPTDDFDHFSVEQGLSQSTVLAIVQDNEGYMWFGTVDGLNRFDGNNFTVFRSSASDSNSLSDDWITAMLVDHNGTLWIGTLAGSLNCYGPEEGRFKHCHLPLTVADSPFRKRMLAELPFIYDYLNDNSITAIYEDSNGELWIGTFGYGLYYLDRKQERLIRMSVVNPIDDSPITDIMAIGETVVGAKSIIWLGTFGSGLVKIIDKKVTTIYTHDPNNPNSLSDNRILSVCSGTLHGRQVLWVGTLNAGLDRLDPERETFVHFWYDTKVTNGLSNDCVTTLLSDQSQNLWIGTLGGGLDRFDNNTGLFAHNQHDPALPNSIGSNDIFALFEDRSGIIWVGTNIGNGVNKLDRQRNKFYHSYHDPGNPNSLSENTVYSICEDRQGILWLGTMKTGLNRYDRAKNQYTNYRHQAKQPASLSDNHVRAIFEDSHSEFWLGTFSGGLDRLNRSTYRFEHFRHDPADSTSISANQVRTIYEDAAGRLWIGTFGGGLNRFDRESSKFTRFQNDPDNPNSLSDDRIYAICGDSSGLWIATFGGGINHFDPQTGTFISYQHRPDDPNSISDNRVFTLLQDPNAEGFFWLGTAGRGLDKFDVNSKRFTHFTKDNGLPNNVIYGILADNVGNLWLSTNKGLSKFNLTTETFTNYDVANGLQGDEFNAGACFKSKSGEMFFGGINGFNSFYPDKIRRNMNVPPIILTSFKVFDNDLTERLESRTSGSPIELSFRDNFFSFEFSALDYTNLKKNQFAYKMEGLNNDWVKCGSRRFVNFTNLDPGDYTFRVKGSNSDGVWNEEGTFVRIRIEPPFWREWWFYILATSGVLSLIGFFYRHRLKVNIKRSLEIQRVRLEENEQVRKTMIADFHDELGQKLTRISLFSEIARKEIKTVSPDGIEYLDKIKNTAKELTSAIRDSLWTMDPTQNSLYDIAIYLKDFGDEIFDKTGIDFRVKGISAELANIKLPMKWIRHLTLIFKEAMNNVLKHAGCRNVYFNIQLKHSQLQISLADDGVGYDPGKKSSGFGINSMKHRAEQIQSKINIISEFGKGTTIQFVGEIP